jgi:hypothetical protein
MRIEFVLPFALLLSACDPPKPAHDPTTAAASSSSSDDARLRVEDAVGIGDPEIEFVNPTKTSMTVVMSGASDAKVEVPALQSRSLKVAAGQYSVGVLGEDPSGDEHFTLDRDRRYRVLLRQFYEMDEPRYRGKGLECVPVTTFMQYYLCGRTKKTCEFYRSGAPADVKPGECAHFKSMFGYRATLPEGVSDGFASTAAECDALRAAYLEGRPSASVTPCALVE